jgi:L-asparaginase
VTLRVLLLETGGTIGSEDSGHGLEPSGSLTLGHLAGSAVPEVEHAVATQRVFALSSGAIGLPEIGVLHGRIREAEGQGYDGVVVTHGTDTLAETAFVLTVLGAGSVLPVVLTGAMRALGQAGSDATRNIEDATTVALSAPGRGLGVAVTMGGAVFDGLTVEKRSSHSLLPLHVPEGGPLGHVVEGRFRLRHTPAPSDRLTSASLDPALARPVAILCPVPGDDGESLRLCAAGFDGLVVVGLGGGHVPPQMMSALEDVARRKPVVVTTTCPGAAAMTATYGGPGSERAISDAGAHIGWSLGPRKAALLLAMCLGQTDDFDRIATTLHEVRNERVRQHG